MIMKDLQIAKREHLTQIASLEAKTFAEPWSERALELFLSDGGFCIVCMQDNELCAYCTVTTVLDEAQIINVAAAESFKRQGCATSVLTRVLDECSKRGIGYISLEVRESNEGAIALYRGLGFSVAGKRRAFYQNPREDALVMIKNLD